MRTSIWHTNLCQINTPFFTVQLCDDPCVSSTKLKQTMKGSLRYSESIYVHFRLNKAIMLQELWIFFACVYTKKMSTTTVTWKIVCHWLLPPLMPLQCGLKYSPYSTEWIDVHYKHICGNTSILWNRSFMICTRDATSMPIGNK